MAAGDSAAVMMTADIGGTNARLQLWHAAADGSVGEVFRATYTTYTFARLADILATFLRDAGGAAPSVAILSVCGPVWNGGRSNDPSNVIHRGVRWPHHHADDIEAAVPLPRGALTFVNDFEAIGHCLAAHLDAAAPAACKPTGITPLYTPPPAGSDGAGAPAAGERFPVACLGAGTGLGACYLTPPPAPPPAPYIVSPSEAGMTYTAYPRSEREWQLLAWLAHKYPDPPGTLPVCVPGEPAAPPPLPFLEIEKLVCGAAIADFAAFLGRDAATPAATRALLDAVAAAERDDPLRAPALVAAAAAAGDAVATTAVDWFLSWYGRTLATAAMTWLPYTGLYIAGGVLPKLAWRLASSRALLDAYLNAGPRMSAVVARVPLLLLDDADAGVKGCLYVAHCRRRRCA